MSDNAYLYRLINKDGLYYSPRATGRSWNKDGKYLTRRQLAQVPALVKAQARVEVFELNFVEEVEIGEIER